MVLKKLLTPSVILVVLDWLRLLWKLRRHRPVVAAHRWLPYLPLIGNGYLRLYFLLESPVPGSSDPTIKAIREKEFYRGAWTANVEEGYTFF